MTASAPKTRSLPISDWPPADRLAWAQACRPGARLKRGGAAAHLKPVTLADLERRYGYFLNFLHRNAAFSEEEAAAGQVTPENVARYIAELQARVGSVTVYGSVYKLRRTAELLALGRDFSWLREIEKDLDATKIPKSKYPRLVTTTALVEAGLTLCREAELVPPKPEYVSVTWERRRARRRLRGAADRATLSHAVLARNGLMLAMLGFCPIRLKNFAALELGRSLRQVGPKWWIVLDPEDTKTGRADERRLPALVAAALTRYPEHSRPILSRARLEPHAGPLWISSQTGSAMSYSSVEATIRRTTGLTLGVEIGPHMARTAAATEAAIRASHLPGLASALLQHAHPHTTEAHYNRATTHAAAQTYADVLAEIGRSD